MKIRAVIVLAGICSFLFLAAAPVKADELSEMKEQIKALQETINAQQRTIDALNAKVQGIEVKQEAQAKEIKKVPDLVQAVGRLKEQPGQLLEGLNVGGHLKLYIFDRTQGERNGDKQHTDLSAGIHHAYLFLTKEIEDWLKFDIQTDLSVSASATPSLGSDITRVDTSTTTYSVYQAFMTALLSRGYELRAGTFNPMYSEEYAKETWWHELYHQNKGLAELQSWHDTGIELYRNFDFENWSLPVYLSLLNGQRYVDNNEDKTVLLHIAPEFFRTKLRFLGSLGFGKWDDGDNGSLLKSALGFEWKYKKLNLTSEYLYQKYGHVTTTGRANADGKKEGYYGRLLYNFTDKWRGLIKYSHAELYKTDMLNMRSDNYDTTTLAVDYFLTPNSTLIGQYSYVDAERSDSSESLLYHRFTLGWRTTF